MEKNVYRSRQDINSAMVCQQANDLRRLAGMTRYRRGYDDGVELRGITQDKVALALEILGLGNCQAFATLLPDARWISKVVHYCMASVEVARWQSRSHTLTILACPERPPSPYPYRRAASG